MYLGEETEKTDRQVYLKETEKHNIGTREREKNKIPLREKWKKKKETFIERVKRDRQCIYSG